MTVFMVMAPPPSGDAARDAEGIVLIKEGFCWPALFVAVPWLLYRTMWLVLIGYLVLAIAVAGAGEMIGGVAPLVMGLAFSLLFSLEANGLRRWTLERRGWTLVGVAAGANRDECEARFFANREAPADIVRQPTASAVGGRTTTSAPAFRKPTPSDEVIGLFPEASR